MIRDAICLTTNRVVRNRRTASNAVRAHSRRSGAIRLRRPNAFEFSPNFLGPSSNAHGLLLLECDGRPFATTTLLFGLFGHRNELLKGGHDRASDPILWPSVKVSVVILEVGSPIEVDSRITLRESRCMSLRNGKSNTREFRGLFRPNKFSENDEAIRSGEEQTIGAVTRLKEVVIERYTLLRDEESAASVERVFLAVYPDIKVLFRLVAMQGNVQAFDYLSPLGCAVEERSQEYFTSSVKGRPVWPEKYGGWLSHHEPPPTKKRKPRGDGRYDKGEDRDDKSDPRRHGQEVGGIGVKL